MCIGSKLSLHMFRILLYIHVLLILLARHKRFAVKYVLFVGRRRSVMLNKYMVCDIYS